MNLIVVLIYLAIKLISGTSLRNAEAAYESVSSDLDKAFTHLISSYNERMNTELYFQAAKLRGSSNVDKLGSEALTALSSHIEAAKEVRRIRRIRDEAKATLERMKGKAEFNRLI